MKAVSIKALLFKLLLLSVASLLSTDILAQTHKFTQEDTPPFAVSSVGVENETSLQVLLVRIKQARGIEIPLPVPRLRIVIFKQEHLLSLYAGTTYLKSFIISLGQTGLDDKQKQGDHLTPEGVFYFVTINALYGTKMLGFMGISYPNSEDAMRLYAEDSDNIVLASDIIRATRQRKTDDFTFFWYTGLGGEVGIHGGSDITFGGGKAHGHDWTWGCIGLRNNDMIELREAIPSLDEHITPVVIFHSIKDLGDSDISSAFELFLIHPDPYIDTGTLREAKIPDAFRYLFENNQHLH